MKKMNKNEEKRKKAGVRGPALYASSEFILEKGASLESIFLRTSLEIISRERDEFRVYFLKDKFRVCS